MSSLPRPLFQSFQSLGRKWLKRTRPMYLNNKPTFEFTVASYNVLADQLLHDHPHLYFSRGVNESWIFDWNYRKKNLIAEIAYSNADILCLQEVQEEHFYNWFHPRLKEYGYTGIYNKRSGSKQDGCATFFKHEVFNMDSHHMLHFYKPNSSFMDRDNVAILVFLTPRNKAIRNSTPICIGNTHLLFNKKRGDIKLAQLAHLFAEIDKHTGGTNRVDVPLILCGDFNSTPYSPLYDFVTTGNLKFHGMSKASISGQQEKGSFQEKDSYKLYAHVFPDDLGLTHTCKWRNSIGRSHTSRDNARIDLTGGKPPQIDLTNCENDHVKPALREEAGYLRHDLDLRSCYMHRCIDGIPEVTTCHDHACFTVDYIFYSPGLKPCRNEPKMWLSGVLSLLSETELYKMEKLPNKHISSDHLLLMSSFVLS